MNYTEQEVKDIIKYTKHLEYLDGTKAQRDCDAEYILDKFNSKYNKK